MQIRDKVIVQSLPCLISEFSSFTSPILDIPQVAITLVYRYQPRARAPIDAGELVADTGKVGDYRVSVQLVKIRIMPPLEIPSRGQE